MDPMRVKITSKGINPWDLSSDPPISGQHMPTTNFNVAFFQKRKLPFFFLLIFTEFHVYGQIGRCGAVELVGRLTLKKKGIPSAEYEGEV